MIPLEFGLQKAKSAPAALLQMASRPGSKRPRANAPSAGAEAPAPAPDSGSLGLGSASAAGAGKIVAAPPITAINRVGAPASALGTAVPAPSLGGGGGGVLARMMNAAMTSGTAATGHVMAGTLSKNLQALEDSNDPLLFSQELVSDGWDPSGGKDLVVTVPDGFSSTAGNTMTARCTVRNMPVSRACKLVHFQAGGSASSSRMGQRVVPWSLYIAVAVFVLFMQSSPCQRAVSAGDEAHVQRRACARPGPRYLQSVLGACGAVAVHGQDPGQ